MKHIGRVALSVLLVAAGVLIPQSAAQAFFGLAHIKGMGSEKCIDVPGSTLSRVQLDIYTCYFPMSSYPNLLWDFEDVPDRSGYYRIRSVSSDQCITVLNASMDVNAKVIQYPCVSWQGNDEWAPIDRRDEEDSVGTFQSYRLKNRKSGLCLSVLNASRANNAPLIQHRCNSTLNNDRWTWYNNGA